MKHIKALVHQYKTKGYITPTISHPTREKMKVHILFVSPYVNSTGYYRAILPYLELNKTDTHIARMTSISYWDFTKTFSLDNLSIKSECLQWADYIVFPALTNDYTYLLKGIKAMQPEVELVMDIDKPLHYLPRAHPLHKKMDDTAKKNLLQNMAIMDIVTSHNEDILLLYLEMLRPYTSEDQIVFEAIPDLIAPSGFDSITLANKPNDNCIKVGILGSVLKEQDILLLKELLIKLKKEYQEKLMILCVGWNGVLKDGSKPLKEISITYIKSVSFVSYYKKLAALRLDIVLLPVVPTPQWLFAPYRDFLEVSVLKIPVIASKASIYKRIIAHGKTGFLADTLTDWEIYIKQLITHKELRKKISDNAFEEVRENHGYSPDHIEIFQEIFF